MTNSATQTYPTPIVGTIVKVYPQTSAACGGYWEARIVGFTPTGELRVRSTRPDAMTTQTISRDGRVEVKS